MHIDKHTWDKLKEPIQVPNCDVEYKAYKTEEASGVYIQLCVLIESDNVTILNIRTHIEVKMRFFKRRLFR